MANILIRDVPDEVMAAIDARVERVGLSRMAYLQRVLERERAHDMGPVTAERLAQAASLARDIDDPEVMARAWA